MVARSPIVSEDGTTHTTVCATPQDGRYLAPRFLLLATKENCGRDLVVLGQECMYARKLERRDSDAVHPERLRFLGPCDVLDNVVLCAAATVVSRFVLVCTEF